MLKTKFYLNGKLYNQDEHLHDDNLPVTREKFSRGNVKLHILNDTGEVWKNPTIKFRFSPNWGGDPLEITKTLPTLNIDASTDFTIPFNSYELPDKKPLHVCLQIWLEGDESKMDEHYWCIWFDITD